MTARDYVGALDDGGAYVVIDAAGTVALEDATPEALQKFAEEQYSYSHRAATAGQMLEEAGAQLVLSDDDPAWVEAYFESESAAVEAFNTLLAARLASCLVPLEEQEALLDAEEGLLDAGDEGEEKELPGGNGHSN